MPVFLSQMFFFDINSNIYERSLVRHVIKNPVMGTEWLQEQARKY